jgi:mannose-6-phosphate isomerase
MIVDRPWGRLATYALNQPVTVRLVTVDPGAQTGAHYHRLREEMWIVLDPGLTVEIGNRIVEAAVGEEFTVPAEEAHRVRSAGTEPGRILQIAFGYSSEDDRLLVNEADEDDDEW